MMNALRTISAWLGARVERRRRRRISEGRFTTIPLSLWCATPNRVRNWLIHRVFRPSERWLDSRLTADEYLGSLDLGGRTSWSLSADSLVLLARVLRAYRTNYILEFGSGGSTLVSAQYAAQIDPDGPPRVYSIEHDSDWLEKTRSSLESNGLDRYVKLIHAPLVEGHYCGRDQLAYSFSPETEAALNMVPGFDLCLIDGPPGNIGRLACLPLASGYLGRGAIVLLDDAYRIGERAIWRIWRQDYSSLRRSKLVLTLNGLARGEWI